MCPKVTAQYKSEVREKIIESAVECFARTGFDRTKMDDIANLSDVSKGTLYLYFKSKEDLFYGICQNSLKKVKEQVNGMLITKENLVSDAERFYDYFQKGINPYQKYGFIRNVCYGDPKSEAKKGTNAASSKSTSGYIRVYWTPD